MHVLIVTTPADETTQAGSIAHDLTQALRDHGHSAETVIVPFVQGGGDQVVKQALACQLMNYGDGHGSSIDRLIGLRFPAYLIEHPKSVLWVHEVYTPAYEQPFCEGVRVPGDLAEAIRNVDRQRFARAEHVFADSDLLAERLRAYLGLDTPVLRAPPPLASLLSGAEAHPYLLAVADKLQGPAFELLLRSGDYCRQPVQLKLAALATADSNAQSRWCFASGAVFEVAPWCSSQELADLFNRCLAVVDPGNASGSPTLGRQAALASKCLVSCSDGSAARDGVVSGSNGWIVEPSARGIAQALDRIWLERDETLAMGAAARTQYAQLDISWENTLAKLLG